MQRDVAHSTAFILGAGSEGLDVGALPTVGQMRMF